MSELRVTRRWVVVIATWLVAATVSPGLAHAEPSETWNGSISYDPDGARTIGTFTVDVAPDGVAAGQGMGAWTGLGTMDPMGIEVTGRRTSS